MSSRRFRIHTWIGKGGERRCFLKSFESGLPHLTSLYYVTAKIRNAGLSLSAMQSAYASINVLLDHCVSRDIDLLGRFERGEFFDSVECEAIRRAARKDYGRSRRDDRMAVVGIAHGKKGYRAPEKQVTFGVEYTRLTDIANYVMWLGQDACKHSSTPEAAGAIDRMGKNILALRPTSKKQLNDDELGKGQKGISDEQAKLLVDMLLPGSSLNPFEDPGVQLRNYVLVQILRMLGKRQGEVLNVWVSDLDRKDHLLSIARRADEPKDSRTRQPLVKTKAHTLALDPRITALLLKYILIRRQVPGASKHPYLFVVHKPGPTLGQPLSIEALKSLFNRIRAADARLSAVTRHDLRHTFNRHLSEAFDRSIELISDGQQQRIRANLNGWQEDSEMSKVYNKRHTSRKSRQYGLQTQAALFSEKGAEPSGPASMTIDESTT